MHKRFREAWLIFASLSIAACAGPARREHPIYWYDTAPPAGFPETVRTVTEDRVSFEKDTLRFMTELQRASKGGPVNVLALSGGGAGAAFGAGALTGLSKGGATTHWKYVESFARQHPGVSWDPNPIWVQDGNIYTSAGGTAGMDLALALIEEDYGSALALAVARRMVIFLRRPGSQAQFSVALSAQATERKGLQELQVWIAENLAKDLSVEMLAQRAAMSARNFARVFALELGITPAHYVEQARIEAARTQLTSTDDSVEQIANRCGFSSAELLRRCFVRYFKIAPSQYRKHFRMPGAVEGREEAIEGIASGSLGGM
jgi:transcriptional regulator GlxA family with amidase domain